MSLNALRDELRSLPIADRDAFYSAIAAHPLLYLPRDSVLEQMSKPRPDGTPKRLSPGDGRVKLRNTLRAAVNWKRGAVALEGVYGDNVERAVRQLAKQTGQVNHVPEVGVGFWEKIEALDRRMPTKTKWPKIPGEVVPVGGDPTGTTVTEMWTPASSSWTYGQSGIRWVINHTPQGTLAGTIATIMNRANEVSYHRLGHPDGLHAHQFVPWSKKAWHAGDDNGRSEGISALEYADQLTPAAEDWLARTTAWRLRERGLPPRYDPDQRDRGFLRHGDTQRDREDPMRRERYERVIVPKVKAYYAEYT